MGISNIVRRQSTKEDRRSDVVRDCDSPMSLVNNTFEWLKKEWADEVDFVVCESEAVVLTSC